MPSVARVGDKMGDGDSIEEGSPTVFVNGKPVARVGDKNSDRDTIKTGSGSVFINGKPVARVGDQDDDGPPDSIHEGSQNVFAG